MCSALHFAYANDPSLACWVRTNSPTTGLFGGSLNFNYWSAMIMYEMFHSSEVYRGCLLSDVYVTGT